MDKVITISREYGAGGHSIGRRVAQDLGIEIYDKDIVRETVKASGFDAELVEREQEESSRSTTFFKNLLASSAYYHDPQDAIHEVQQAVILRFAQKGPCLILGRCADEVLRRSGVPCLNVFLHASPIHRAARVREITGVYDPTEIQRIMTRKDLSRKNYYAHYTGRSWGDSHNYHLALDSGVLGYDRCVQMILNAVKD